MNNTAFICTLPVEEQNRIRETLENVGVSAEDIELAMNSRVCDVEQCLMCYIYK